MGSLLNSESNYPGSMHWPGTLCCVLGLGPLLSQYRSQPRCINGYWKIYVHVCNTWRYPFNRLVCHPRVGMENTASPLPTLVSKKSHEILMKDPWIFFEGHEYCNFIFSWTNWIPLIFRENSSMTMKSRHWSRTEINGSLKSVFMAMKIHE